MIADPLRTLHTVTAAGGFPGPYELAADPTKSTVDTAVKVAEPAEKARIERVSGKSSACYAARIYRTP